MINRLQQVFRKFIFCLRISGSARTFLLLVLNSKRFNRFQRHHIAGNEQNQAMPVRYSIVYRGKKQLIYLRTYAGDIRMFYEIFLEQVYKLSPAVSFVNGVIVDAGANIGMAAMYFYGLFPEATVYCIEPAGENAALLAMNMARGISTGKVHITQAALYVQDGEVNISGNKWAYNIAIDTMGHAMVPSISMDSFLQKNKLERIDLLKIDIEGAEAFIFFPNAGWLKKVNAILIEIHTAEMVTAIHSVLSGAGFDCHNWQHRPLASNVFFASRPSKE